MQGGGRGGPRRGGVEGEGEERGAPGGGDEARVKIHGAGGERCGESSAYGRRA